MIQNETKTSCTGNERNLNFGSKTFCQENSYDWKFELPTFKEEITHFY